MYLSKVEIDVCNRKKIRDLKHLGCYHGWIESSFPLEFEKAKEERTRKLWRIDSLDGKLYLLLLSETKPDMALLERYGVKGSSESKSYDDFINNLKEGMRAKFRIKLNTVKSYSDRSKYEKRGRVAPVPLKELNKFFLERTEKNGFSVKDDEFSMVNRGEELFQKQDGDNKKINLDLVGATYEGILTITDLEKFEHALTRGIGKKKAYGFGLLTIIPINE